VARVAPERERGRAGEGDVREGAQGGRERGLGMERLMGRAHQGGGGGSNRPRAGRAWGHGGGGGRLGRVGPHGGEEGTSTGPRLEAGPKGGRQIPPSFYSSPNFPILIYFQMHAFTHSLNKQNKCMDRHGATNKGFNSRVLLTRGLELNLARIFEKEQGMARRKRKRKGNARIW
jgi:hypothetical protein